MYTQPTTSLFKEIAFIEEKIEALSLNIHSFLSFYEIDQIVQNLSTISQKVERRIESQSLPPLIKIKYDRFKQSLITFFGRLHAISIDRQVEEVTDYAHFLATTTPPHGNTYLTNVANVRKGIQEMMYLHALSQENRQFLKAATLFLNRAESLEPKWTETKEATQDPEALFMLFELAYALYERDRKTAHELYCLLGKSVQSELNETLSFERIFNIENVSEYESMASERIQVILTYIHKATKQREDVEMFFNDLRKIRSDERSISA